MALGCANDDPRGAARLCVFENGCRRRRTVQRHSLCPQRLGETQNVNAAVAIRLRQIHQARGLDIHHGPRSIQRVGHSFPGPHQLFGLRIRTDGHEHAVTCKTPAHSVAGKRSRRSLDPIRDLAQRELAERHQIGRPEESLDSGGHFVGHVDLAGPQPGQQIIRRQIDQLDLVRLIEDPVR